MLVSEIPIHSEIRLVLIVRFGRCSNVVVSTRNIRQRIVQEDLRADGIETACRNRVVRKLSPRRGCRIENGLVEDALTLSQCGYHAETGYARPQPCALPVSKE